MSTFDDCLAFVLKWEGGLSDDPNDPGGLTKYGIAQVSHPDLDIRNLTQTQAADIYGSEYWQPAHCPVLEPPVALMQFDCAVNCGIERAVRFLQASCGATIDGKFGPETLAKYWATDEAALLKNYYDTRESYYRSLSNFRYGKGWLARVEDCYKTARAWLEAKSADVPDPAG